MKTFKYALALGITIVLLTSCGNSSKSNNLPSNDKQIETTSVDDLNLIVGTYYNISLSTGIYHTYRIERDGTWSEWDGNNYSPEINNWTGTANNLMLHHRDGSSSAFKVTEEGLRLQAIDDYIYWRKGYKNW